MPTRPEPDPRDEDRPRDEIGGCFGILLGALTGLMSWGLIAAVVAFTWVAVREVLRDRKPTTTLHQGGERP